MDSLIGIFISYSHQNRFEAATLAQELSKIGFHCWIDFKGIVGGEMWRESIEQGLQNSLVTLVVLTPESIASEWVHYEIKRAHEYNHIILPVMFRQCDIPPILEPYQYINFTMGPDYERLYQSVVISVTRRLRQSTSSPQHHDHAPAINLSNESTVLEPPAESLILERPDGTMRAESLFYIERQGDHILERELSGSGATVVIKAPRQVGKSSMLVHAMRHRPQTGKVFVLLDFQALDTLDDADLFYKDFCAAISHGLRLENRVEEVWERARSNTRAATLYMERHVLALLDQPLVLCIDEADRMFDCPFRSDFFGMLRSWHNSRGTSDLWRRLDMLLVISTEPYMLIENSAQSPFNVGEIIELEDFTLAHCAELNARHGEPLQPYELKSLYTLTSGHPFLVRQSLYRVAVGEVTANALLHHEQYKQGSGGIFADHLRRYQAYFKQQPHLSRQMMSVIQGQTSIPDEDFHRLRSAGLVIADQRQVIRPRCQLYALYFGTKLS